MRLGTPSGTQSLAERILKTLNGTPRHGTPNLIQSPYIHLGLLERHSPNMTTETLDLKWNTLSANQKKKALDLLHADHISKRTKAALAKLKKTRKLGRPPFGYKYVNGKLVSHMEQSITLSRMVELRDLGYNPNQIMKILNEEKRPSSTGKRWAYQSVRLILSRQPLSS